ncbi:MAG TPA: multiheme c-type cytochrome [Longimicrobiales bacterium]|nr:multiheme c-type cytochrome [Longimicrobiales bacterium]
MERYFSSTLRALSLTLLIALAACNDQIVYRDAQLFEQPPAGAADFLGYTSVATKKTVCGNCHVGKQAEWEQTRHAGAWQTLQSSGASQALCEKCHSVSAMGNIATAENVGWPATKNERYQDVQCESCHGPGLTHVMNPDANNKPLATLAVDTALTRGCGECHSGTHRPFAEDWRGSKHARVIVSRATNANCVGCHEAKGILAAWGVKSTFLTEAAPNQHLAVTCPVCHDPHDARNEGQLRFPMDVPVIEQNLCMKCHLRRANPDINSAAGPHSPEGPLLLGEAGWFPPNFAFPPGAIVGSHGSDRNPRLCATCHVNDYQITDPVTGAFSFRATGHSFQAIPCVDANGIPTQSTTCELTERSFRSCTSCHLSEAAARSALSVAETRIDELVTTLNALIARIPTTEFSTTDNRYTTGEGSKFNVALAVKTGSAAHNPFLVEALLRASIKQIGIDYNLTPAGKPLVDLAQQE